MRKMKKHSKKLLFILSFGAFIILTNFTVQLFSFSNQVENVVLENAFNKTLERQNLIKEFLKRSENAILGIRNSAIFDNFISNPNMKNRFKYLALNIANSHSDIMSISFLEKSGRELIKVVKNREGKAYFSSNLQDKSHRYYYKKVSSLPIEQIWFSKIDLNMEYRVIERPYKPTLRVIMPIFKGTESKGMLVINYHVKPLLEALFSVPLYNMVLADSDGNILIHYDSNRNWSKYNNGKNLSFDVSDISNVLKNETYRGDNYFSRKLDLPLDNQLILVLSLNQDYLKKQRILFIKNSLYNTVLTIIIIALLSFIFIKYRNKFLKKYEERGESIAILESLNKEINILLLENKAYMEMASDGVCVINERGDIVANSLSFAEMLGYTSDDASKLNIRDWDVNISQTNSMAFLESINNTPNKFETQHRCKNGSLIDVELNIKRISISEITYFYISSRDITERKKMEEELRMLATTDCLTQLPVRRIFNQRLAEELERHNRNNHYDTSVAMLDIDNFKSINDNYGHAVGDIALRHVSTIIQNNIRKLDIVSRLGGDEFGMIFVDTNKSSAAEFLERIRSKIHTSFLSVDGKKIFLSVSIGVTNIKQHDEGDSLKIADKALYNAKKLGRNRVEIL